MQQIFKNLYIDTYSNFNNDVNNELSNLIKNKIKLVINLTECDQLTTDHRLSLICNKIKCKDIFNHIELIRIKKIPPNNRSNNDIKKRYNLRDKLIHDNSNVIYDLSKLDTNILFLCNRNNVLSQLFVFIIMTLRNESKYIEKLIKDRSVVTSDKNETDIKKYLDKYIDIIYNNINEVSKQTV